ncbi:Inositol monophosphatase family protein [Tritrichomonas foetus]|uniref:Inositol monophosphatase family protein n=1 Tax=Tritrichomonas foetus TaxID=1144522 RepID=A0A1J4JY93_9EUKA|nr:Inositol monophosphatase family protein [Tritrichomonas foetus]|eukprot:OHT03666.1 Inositol monophosphatase family protein [Tritrichomonas foetus]
MSRFGEYTHEIEAGIQCVKPAIELSLVAQQKLQASQIEKKSDGTVVSICDFAVQTLIMKGIHEHFPGDIILGEEDVSHGDQFFIDSVKSILPGNIDPVSECKDCISSITDDMHRVWVIDPIDGTYGFIINKNYAIAMALLIDLKVVASIVAWPRHQPESSGIPVNGPLIFVSALGHGSYAVDMQDNYYPINKNPSPRNRLVHSEQAKGKHLELTQYILKKLDIPESMAMVSMTKGFTIATGQNCVYVRLREVDDEHVWDIAPFEMLVREAGGFATTPDGKQMVYTKEGRVANTKDGILFSCRDEKFHQDVLNAFKEAHQKFYS